MKQAPKHDDAAPVGVRHREDTKQIVQQIERSALDWIAQRRRKWRVVATKANGARAILLSSRDRAECDAWALRHRPFAIAAGGDVVVEVDEMVVVEARR